MDQLLTLFESSDGEIKVNVKFDPEQETFWMTINEMAELFSRNKSVISRHLRSIYDSGELEAYSTVAFFATVQDEGGRRVTRNIEYYNLDAILAVGYRVNSRRGAQFRKWASVLVKDHIIKGYTINKGKFLDPTIEEFTRSLDLIARTIGTVNESTSDISLSAIEIIKSYAKSWKTLVEYDEGVLEKPVYRSNINSKPLSYEECKQSIESLKRSLVEKGEATNLFGIERNKGLKGILGNIEQTFDNMPLYSNVEERAANLIYFLIKDHPFTDGNKRIGSFIFLLYLKLNNILEPSIINDVTLVTLALLIAESNPKEKELVINLIQHMLNRNH